MQSIPETRTPLLVVDDDVGLLLSIQATLASAGMPEAALVSESRRVMELVREHHFHLLLLDLVMPQLSGMDILRLVKREFPTIECVIITAIDEVSSAVKAMQYGAYDYLVKPLQNERLIIVVKNALERYNLRQGLSLFESKQSFSDLKQPEAFKDMVAEDEAMALVFHLAETAGATDYNLLITGETGTGKEMLARTVHDLSRRADGPFVGINVGAISKMLFEDEIFGHAKGAFTGAQSDRKGFFEVAQGGTLFLDEITELSPVMQGKLLRVIEERELYRLGSTETRGVDVRVIAATNRDIREETRRGRFREDLYHRLNTFQIRIPPLRDRKDDVLPLAYHFLKKHGTVTKKGIRFLASDLTDALLAYSFPGNVRELENIIASSLLMEKGKDLTLSSVPELVSCLYPASIETNKLVPLSYLEKRHIYRVLEATGGNRTAAAKILGIGLRTLQRKLKAFGEPKALSK